MRRLASRTLILIGLLAIAATGAPAEPVAGQAAALPPEVRQMQQLMQSPAFKSWLDARPAAMPSAVQPLDLPRQSFSQRAAERVAAARAHIDDLLAASLLLPTQLRGAAAKLASEFKSAGVGGTAFSLTLVVACGLALEGLYVFAAAAAGRRNAQTSLDEPARRMQGAWLFAAHYLSRFAVFAAGTLAGLLMFEHPPLIRQIGVALLLATVATRLGLLLAAFAFPPTALTTEATPGAGQGEAMRFRRLRLGVALGIAAFGWAIMDVLPPLGFSVEAREIVTDLLALALVGVCVEAIWRDPILATGVSPRGRADNIRAWAATIYLVLLWLLFVADMRALFWPALLAYVLPKSLTISSRALRQWLGTTRPNSGEPAATSLTLVYVDRFVRVLLVVGAALLLAYGWRIDLKQLARGDTLEDRLLRGLLSSVVILFMADLLWHLAKTFIDRTLARSRARTGLEAEAAARHARLRTLLPIMRNMLFIVIAVMAVLMALSALGVAIGPLIAGAGVVGVAIGFGSQTLVKDIISGVFYLLDDAFRVGEYIESGAYTGTVESFSLRSVRLRHPRGGVFTVPFGELGAIENLSRDWAIDKFTVNVRYDTDFGKAKRLVKEVSAKLLIDPDVGQSFIEPLKMQGIQELGAYSVALRMKMTVRPGEQTTVRRKVLAMIKSAFEENGIGFPFPTVHVEAPGRDAALVVAAQQALGANAEVGEVARIQTPDFKSGCRADASAPAALVLARG